MAKFEYRAQVRFIDVDQFGHVNNAVHFSYFENAREALYVSRRPDGMTLAELAGPGVFILVSNQRIEYAAPLAGGQEPVIVTTWVSRLGNSSFDFAYELLDAAVAVTYATAAVGMVMVSRESGRPVPAVTRLCGRPSRNGPARRCHSARRVREPERMRDDACRPIPENDYN